MIIAAASYNLFIILCNSLSPTLFNSCLAYRNYKTRRSYATPYSKDILPRFARLCVEIDLEKPLVSKFQIGSLWQKVEYEGLHLICFECGRVGHIGEACLSKKPPAGADAGGSDPIGGQEENIRGDRFSSEDRAFGPWMIVTKTNRRGTRTGKQGIENSGAVASGSGSRFDALASELAQDERAQPAGASLHATLGQVRDKNNRQAHVTKEKSVTPVPHALGKGKELAGTQQGVSRGGKVRAEPSISKPYMAGNHKDISNMEMEVSTVSAPVNSLGTLQTFNISVQAPKGRLVNTVSSVNSKGSLLV